MFDNKSKEPKPDDVNVIGARVYHERLEALKQQRQEQFKQESSSPSGTTKKGPRPVMEKLPDFFPTFAKKCEKPAQAFFKCFEEEAKMKDKTDKMSCKIAVLTCQSQLDEYADCQQKHYTREGKPWWKAW